MIDIDVAVQRRRDFALNRHLYIFLSTGVKFSSVD